MTPDEELAALRRLAELQGSSAPQPQLSLMDKASLAGDVALEKIGRPLARGGLNVLQGIDASMRGNPVAQMNPLVKAYTSLVPAPNAEVALPTPQNETKPETYSRRMLEGLPTAALGGGQAAAMAIPSMIGPAVGQAAGDFVKGISSKLAPWADMIANALTQGGMGLVSGMRKGWPSSSADEAASDTGTLTNMALDRIGPPKSGLSVANATSNAANAAEKGVEGQATSAFGSLVEGATIKPRQAADIYNYLRGEAARIEQTGVGQPGEAKALRMMADKFIKENGSGFVTDVPSLSLSIKTPKLDPNQTSISDNNLKAAIKTTETALADISPEFASANKVYSYVKQTMERPLKEGVIGRLSDTNPYPADPTAPGRLNALVKDTSPPEQVAAIQSLQAHGANPQDIARAIVAKKVEGGGLLPGARVFGGPGSAQEEAMNTLLQSAGKSPETVRAPLGTADAIAKALVKGNNSLSESLSIHPGGLSLRGIARPGIFEKIGGMFGGNPGSQSVTKLIESASPEEIAKLQQLAAYDPQLRMALSLMGIGRATLPSMPDVMKAGQ